MPIRAEIHWDGRYDIKRATFLHCATIVDTGDFSKTFSMNLDSCQKLGNYLNGVTKNSFGGFSGRY